MVEGFETADRRKERAMISGAHAMIFSEDPEADRAFLRDEGV
jgi:hypothetical protein